MTLTAVPSELAAFAAANAAAGRSVEAAGSADQAALLAAAITALGPIGVTYVAAYAPAQANVVAATMAVAGAHHAIGAATNAARVTFVSADEA